ncbi:MAG: hypothetical protein JJU34_02850 [Lunatimonas sp.]|uniref:hypothetical protein n=1 Tax=Lunatimonas sp. TaxID=2060141 RepID=UPI00263BA2ED|nr:hypothetical protein [Lunatimonas sp.]MCC5936199.1 hypothetical protein [Lunatimonas sp.]
MIKTLFTVINRFVIVFGWMDINLRASWSIGSGDPSFEVIVAEFILDDHFTSKSRIDLIVRWIFVIGF